MKKEILNYTVKELKKEIVSLGELAYRAEQIFSAVNKKDIADLSDVKGLPAALIGKLKEIFSMTALACAEHLRSRDGAAEKFLWELKDGKYVETVLIKSKDRKTLCLSTQVGCRFNCPFCASGSRGFTRDLDASEIVGQILAVRRMTKESATNIVFMGMGEPLDNYGNLERAVRIINAPEGMNIGARKITISTCGLVPGIGKLKDIGMQVELSVSLHAAYDKLRDVLVPANKKYPLAKLIQACREHTEATGRIVTLEYTLIRGVNDTASDIEKLAKIAKEIKAKVNLIACNTRAEERSPADKHMARKWLNHFGGRLRDKGISVTIRESKGADIMAACGQLAAKKRSGRKHV